MDLINQPLAILLWMGISRWKYEDWWCFPLPTFGEQGPASVLRGPRVEFFPESQEWGWHQSEMRTFTYFDRSTSVQLLNLQVWTSTLTLLSREVHKPHFVHICVFVSWETHQPRPPNRPVETGEDCCRSTSPGPPHTHPQWAAPATDRSASWHVPTRYLPGYQLLNTECDISCKYVRWKVV